MSKKASKFPPKRPDNSHIVKFAPKLNWSEQQKAIFRNIATESGHLIVEAYAGASKTTSIIESFKYVPKGKKTLALAFNKIIQEELKSRAPSYTSDIFTFHGLGNRAIRQRFGDVELDDYKVFNLVKGQLGDDGNYDLITSVCDTVAFCKYDLKDSPNQIDDIIDNFGIDLCEMDRGEFIKLVIKTLTLSKADTKKIDFNDMCYMPFIYNLFLGQYDYVYVDECLPGKTPILLSDGSSKTIKDIVENKLPVSVLSFDVNTGQQRACKVIGYSKTLNQKPMVKIKAKWQKPKTTGKSINRPTNFVVCTIDHKIWANNGWVEAGNIKPGMIVQVETSALKSQFGKITNKGKNTLSKAMTIKNDAGKMEHSNLTGQPPVRGGNGRGLTVPQEYLLSKLGNDWKPEYVVPTGCGRDGSGYPTCYKIDVANPSKMIAIEIDGTTHNTKKIQAKDRKKEKFLEGLGWTIVRLPNMEVIKELDKCLEKISCANGIDCPINATVISVDPIDTNDYFVYDLEVEDCHNFYANGILVHNCQDLNKSQLVMAKKACKLSGGRIIAVGDPFQAIYSWRLADTSILADIKKQEGTKILPLPISYRCPKKVIELAQKWVPGITCPETAIDGEIKDITTDELYDSAKPGCFILSRTNAPMIKICMSFIRKNIKANIKGRDVGKQLTALIKKSKKKQIPAFLKWLGEWKDDEVAKLKAKGANTENILDRVECLTTLCEECKSLEEVSKKTKDLFNDSDEKNVVWLGTVHRMKGKEANDVFLLRWTFRVWFDKMHLVDKPNEESNLAYTGITRCMSRLFIVNKPLV